MTQYMAIDQYGQAYHGLVHPRKDLLEILGYRHAKKMYVDLKRGGYAHIGYVIGGLWLRLYKVEPVYFDPSCPRPLVPLVFDSEAQSEDAGETPAEGETQVQEVEA